MSRDAKYYLQKAANLRQLAQNNCDVEYDDGSDTELYTDIAENYDTTESDMDDPNPIVPPILSRYLDKATGKYIISQTPINPNVKSTVEMQMNANSRVWYPENKLPITSRYITDPETGEMYQVNKVYDENGRFKTEYTPVEVELVKRPGTNYYRPVYRKCI